MATVDVEVRLVPRTFLRGFGLEGEDGRPTVVGIMVWLLLGFLAVAQVRKVF